MVVAEILTLLTTMEVFAPDKLDASSNPHLEVIRSHHLMGSVAEAPGMKTALSEGLTIPRLLAPVSWKCKHLMISRSPITFCWGKITLLIRDTSKNSKT